MRDYWPGIRAIRKDYAPLPYNRKHKAGEIVAQDSRAETAALHLAEEQWGEEYIYIYTYNNKCVCMCGSISLEKHNV